MAVTKKAVAATPTKDEDVAEKKAVTKEVQGEQTAKAAAAPKDAAGAETGKVDTYAPAQTSPVVVPEDVDDHGVSAKVAAPGDPTSAKNEWDPAFVGPEVDPPDAPAAPKAKNGERAFGPQDLPAGQSGKAVDLWRNKCFAEARADGRITAWRQTEEPGEPGRAFVTLYVTVA